jgi:Protein of unknown function (DUF2752)
MTRAVQLLLAGDVRASLAMHPLALAVVVAEGSLVALTLYLIYRDGHPLDLWVGRIRGRRIGRALVWANGGVLVALTILWALREAGFFGGPVPV